MVRVLCLEERHLLDSVQCSRSEGGQVLYYGVSGNSPQERWMAQLDMVPAAPPGDCSRVGFSSIGLGAVG